MKIKKPNIQASNNGQWLVSFADLISLLLAFFVLLYSMTEVPKKEWDVFSDSIVEYLVGGRVSILVVEEDEQPVALQKQKTSGALRPDYFEKLVTEMFAANNELFSDYKIESDEYGLSINIYFKDYIQLERRDVYLSERGFEMLLSLGERLKGIGNMILVGYYSNSFNDSIFVADFMARKIEELGYEYKALIKIPKKQELGDKEGNLEILIKPYETYL
jgi:hypothetical protein